MGGLGHRELPVPAAEGPLEWVLQDMQEWSCWPGLDNHKEHLYPGQEQPLAMTLKMTMTNGHDHREYLYLQVGPSPRAGKAPNHDLEGDHDQ